MDYRTPTGRHALADGHGCEESRLVDRPALESIVTEAVAAGGATLIRLSSHKFEPGGVTVVGLLAESHVSLHTWPETSTAAVDAFTCGTSDPEVICRTILEALGATTVDCTVHGRFATGSGHQGTAS